MSPGRASSPSPPRLSVTTCNIAEWAALLNYCRGAVAGHAALLRGRRAIGIEAVMAGMLYLACCRYIGLQTMCVCNYYFDSRFCWFCGAAALLRGTDVAGDPARGVFPEPCARREVGLAADPGSAFRRSPRGVAGDRGLAEIANPGHAIIVVNSSAISPPTRAWVSVGSAAWQPRRSC